MKPLPGCVIYKWQSDRSQFASCLPSSYALLCFFFVIRRYLHLSGKDVDDTLSHTEGQQARSVIKHELATINVSDVPRLLRIVKSIMS
jgi:hypothetical protein